jgi:uncharacterized protein YcbK (DUF882 family)
MRTRNFIFSTISAATLLVLPPVLLSTAAAPPASLLLGLTPALPDMSNRALSTVSTVSAVKPAAPMTPEVEPLPSREIAVAVKNVNSGEIGTFTLSTSGYVRADQAAALARFFGCRRSGRVKPLANGVLVLLADIAQKWPGRVIEIISGFRAPPYGAPHSKHFIGHAIDLRVPGVRTALVRDFVWREHKGIGVGHYRDGDFLHVDWRPADGDMAWSARHEASRYQYNPRWAKRARRANLVSSNSAAPLTLATASLASMRTR